MFTIKKFVKVESVEEAYELNRKKSNVVIGGMAWLKMSPHNYQTGIDLSGLGLDTIEEDEEEYRIGCMCTLRQLETHDSMNRYFDGVMKECVRNIVGVQFRNCATIGGSIYRRFGFSDILTCFLSLDSYVELHHHGIVSMKDYLNLNLDRDILVRIIIKKDCRKTSYMTQRNSATDFPIIACAVSLKEDQWFISVGARPTRAALVTVENKLSSQSSKEEVSKFVDKVIEEFNFGSNMRASEEYRRQLAKVYVQRCILGVLKGGQHDN
ncbi:MAG TPA: FAD binding domain-containing protein [Candidatus Merdenecus merdavium]|nr:FAD binding domain-containing protein [Candidatus Merdenecus merdavium]